MIASGHRWQEIQTYTMRQIFWFQWAARENAQEVFKSRLHSTRLGTVAASFDQDGLKKFLRELDHGDNN